MITIMDLQLCGYVYIAVLVSHTNYLKVLFHLCKPYLMSFAKNKHKYKAKKGIEK